MLKIRLKRVGRKHDPSFRIVVTESTRGPKSGKYIETVGNYDARSNQKVVKPERIKYWISNGAQVSDTVHNILVSEKVIEGKKVNVLPKKSPIIKEEAPKGETNTPPPADEGGEKVKAEEVDSSVPAEEAPKEEEMKTEETPAEGTPEEENNPSPPASEGGEDVKEETPKEEPKS